MENARVFGTGILSDPQPPFLCEDARKISTPTLLLHGELTPRLFVVINDILEPCLPNEERAVIPSASHGLERDNPAAFNETVLAFLARH
jgi:pimeloyl-ACP methyl ester carboxylesterase